MGVATRLFHHHAEKSVPLFRSKIDFFLKNKDYAKIKQMKVYVIYFFLYSTGTLVQLSNLISFLAIATSETTNPQIRF